MRRTSGFILSILSCYPILLVLIFSRAALAGYEVEHLHTFLNPAFNSSHDRDNFSVGIDLQGEHVFIGARRDDTGAVDAGILHQFAYPSGDLIRSLENPDPGNGDYFGGELEIVGDTVWVGSLFDDTVAPDAGAVYIFDVSTGELLQTLHSPHPSSDGVFGIPILTAGNDVLIGAHGDNADGIPGGAVYRYDAASRELLATYYNPTPAEEDHFGWGVDFADGQILVTARGDDTAGLDSGSAYLLNLEGELLQTFPNPDPNPNDSFLSPALLDETVAIGGMDDDTQAEDSGAVYIFSKDSGELLRTLYHPRSQVGARFGSLLRIGEDLYVGAPTSNGALYPGSAFIFDPRTGGLLHEFVNPISAVRDFFSQPVALDEDRILIGAWGKSPTGILSGAAHLYSVTSVITNQPPTAPVVQILPEEPKTLDDLTCIAEGSVDPEGATVEYSFAWFRDGELLIEEATSVLSHDLTAKGQELVCVVTPSDGEVEGSTGSASVIIGNTTPTAPVVQILPEDPTPQDGLAVYIVTESYDPDGDEIIYIFEWYESDDGVNWTRRPELSAALPFSVGQPEISSLYTQVAEHWRVDVTAVESDSIGSSKDKLGNHGGSVMGEAGSDEVIIQANLSVSGVPGGPEIIDAADLLMLMSVWGETKETVDPNMRDYFFDSTDPAASKIGANQLLSVVGQGWYRQVGQ